MRLPSWRLLHMCASSVSMCVPIMTCCYQCSMLHQIRFGTQKKVVFHKVVCFLKTRGFLQIAYKKQKPNSHVVRSMYKPN